MTTEAKLQVIVKSRKVPSGFATVDISMLSHSGFRMGAESSRAVLYEDVLDENYRRAIADGKRLAEDLGLPFEVVDLSKSGVFRRMFSSLGRVSSGSPKLVITPSYTLATVAAPCEASVPC